MGPAHSNIQGNEEAERLAKEGGRMKQIDKGVKYEETENRPKAEYKDTWINQRPTAKIQVTTTVKR